MPQWYWTAYRSESARRMTRSDSRRSRHRRSDHGGAALRMDCSLFLGVPDGRPKIHTDRLAGYHICPPLRPSRQAAAAAARNLCQVAFEGTLSELPAAESPRPRLRDCGPRGSERNKTSAYHRDPFAQFYSIMARAFRELPVGTPTQPLRAAVQV
ncbi:hypothetical protein BKA93DRAFT_477492 [Sparassis latifolia]